MIGNPNVIHLDRPVEDPAELLALIQADTELLFQTLGPPIGIIKFLEELTRNMSNDWEGMFQTYLLNNLTATQYMYSQGAVKEGDENTPDAKLKAPVFYPMEADINNVYKSDNATDDSPSNELADCILYDVIEDRPASLSRKPFGLRKEVAPRLRFYVETNRRQFPVLAKRKEYVVQFKCFSRSGKMAFLNRNALEYYIDTKKEILFGLGGQKFYVMGDSEGTKKDPAIKMKYRTMYMYLRLEEWYVGQDAPIIEKIDIDWQTRLVNP
jgi:hypothetical protein